MRILRTGFIISLMMFLLSGRVFANYYFYETYYVKKSEFRTGEIVWVSKPLKIDNHQIPAVDKVPAPGDPDSKVGIGVGGAEEYNYPINGLMSLPNNDDLVGMGGGFAWTIIGDLKADLGGGAEDIHWQKNIGDIFGPESQTEILNGLYVLKGGVGTIKSNKSPYSLSGTVKMVIYCRNSKAGCKIQKFNWGPEQKFFSVMLNPKYLGFVARHTTYESGRTIPLLNKQLYILFENLNSCSFEVSPIEHSVGKLSKSAEDDLLTSGKNFISTFTINCTGQKNPPKVSAKLMFGSPLGVVNGNMAKTNIDGVGIVYSNKKIEKCSDGKMYYTNQPFGVGDIQANPVLNQDIYFGVCRYLLPEQIIPNDLNASVTYQYWLDDLPVPEN